MKLTNSMRYGFIAAVLRDVPLVDFDEKATKLVQEAAVNQLPAKVRAVYDDESLRGYLATSRVYMLSSLRDVNVYAPHEYELPEDSLAECRALNDLAEQQDEMRAELRSKLRAAIYACSTLKMAQQRLPEFAQYLPAENEAPKSLPAIPGLVADLVRAGWPKAAA